MRSSPAGNDAGGVSDVVMPKLGLTMTEGVLAEWHVGPGDCVRAGQVMFVVETDKIANEIEAPGNGEIVEILVESGETVAVGTPLARWTGEGAGATSPQEATPRPEQLAVPGDGAEAPRDSPPVARRSSGERIRSTPLARRMARQAGIELAGVIGSGPQGRIKAADIEAAMADATTAPTAMPAVGEWIAIPTRHMAMVRRVVAAKHDIPHFYLTARAKISALIEFRRALNVAGGPRVTLNHLLLKAVGRALLACPEANRIWVDDALSALPASDVGMVVDTGEGLFIPVLRDVGRQPLDALAKAAGAMIARARGGGLQREELEGGAVSVSNVGMAGSIQSVAPIINPPQAAILGVGSVDETFRPDAEGRPTLCRDLILTLACDHRVFNGMGGARFLAAIVQGLESPHALLRTTDQGHPNGFSPHG